MSQNPSSPEKKFDLWEGAETLDTVPLRAIYTCEHNWEKDNESPAHWVCIRCGYGKYTVLKPDKPVNA